MKMGKITERTNHILDTLSTEYTQQAFTHACNIFHGMGSMQVSKPNLHDDDNERE